VLQQGIRAIQPDSPVKLVLDQHITHV